MPRLDHRKLESVLFPSGGTVAALQGDTEDAVRRRGRVKKALALQMVYAAFTLIFVVYEMSMSGSLVHNRPPAELFKVMAYSFSCLAVYRTVQGYLRLMLIWTITTAFSGIYQSLSWLENASGTSTERRLVWTLLWLSVAGMVGNIMGALAVFPSGASSKRARRRRPPSPKKYS